MKPSELAEQLDQIKQHDRYRSRQIVTSPQGVVINCNGQRYINFSSNDYLGLANHPSVVAAFRQGASDWGVGTGSAHLICGHTACHHALEEALAEWTGRERALLFSTGYMANMGVLVALLGRGDSVFEDRLNHASLLDGGRLSGARFKRYLHRDLAYLNNQLETATGDKLIVTDGVFSMDGDFARLRELADLAKQYNAWLMVDDAHGLGVLGETGAGLIQQLGLSQQQVPILMGTLGKAFGTFGAFVAGSEPLIELLIQRARTYVFTTALPAAVVEATRAALTIVQSEYWRRDKLRQRIAQFRRGAEQLGLQIMLSESPIQPVLIGRSRRTLQISSYLMAAGFWVGAIRPPTVAQGESRLRITLSATHQPVQIDALLDKLNQALKQYPS